MKDYKQLNNSENRKDLQNKILRKVEDQEKTNKTKQDK